MYHSVVDTWGRGSPPLSLGKKGGTLYRENQRWGGHVTAKKPGGPSAMAYPSNGSSRVSNIVTNRYKDVGCRWMCYGKWKVMHWDGLALWNKWRGRETDQEDLERWGGRMETTAYTKNEADNSTTWEERVWLSPNWMQFTCSQLIRDTVYLATDEQTYKCCQI